MSSRTPALSPGDIIVYVPDPGAAAAAQRLEVGVVKRLCEDGSGDAFVAYHLGDTCARTRAENMVPLANAYALKGLAERAAQLGNDLEGLSPGTDDWSCDG